MVVGSGIACKEYPKPKEKLIVLTTAPVVTHPKLSITEIKYK